MIEWIKKLGWEIGEVGFDYLRFKDSYSMTGTDKKLCSSIYDPFGSEGYAIYNNFCEIMREYMNIENDLFSGLEFLSRHFSMLN